MVPLPKRPQYESEYCLSMCRVSNVFCALHEMTFIQIQGLCEDDYCLAHLTVAVIQFVAEKHDDDHMLISLGCQMDYYQCKTFST